MGILFSSFGAVVFWIVVVWFSFLSATFIVSFFRGIRKTREQQNAERAEELERIFKWTKN